MTDQADFIRIVKSELLSEGFSVLKKTPSTTVAVTVSGNS